MQRIVSQSVSTSYCHFPPMLALPAPAPIAGLLPARVPSSEPPPAPFSPFIFDRPALADLTAAQREHLYDATNVLLEIAVEFMLGVLNEEAIRAAEVLFHRAVGGKSSIRPLSPAAFNAEIDADWLEMLARAKRARPISYAEATETVHQAQAQRQGAPL